MFVILYRNSNPIFDAGFITASLFFEKAFSFVFKDFDISLLTTFLLGLFISVFLFIRTQYGLIVEIDQASNEKLKRTKKKGYKNFKFNSLLSEYKAGVFLLIILNILILILNIIDIKWVWFSFEWEGQYLKQFVHEGTYLLILSILISIALVLYYFRGNLNFYQNNKWLKYLSYIWLAQNAVLTLSVAIRNFWYIYYFALAYKRIGVIIFLVLTIYGLYTVFVKVQQKKSAFYLFRANAYSLFVALIISSLVNWDTVIAKYNFSHADTSFLHLRYLATLSDKTLPALDKSLPELRKLHQAQIANFPLEKNFMPAEEYHEVIKSRKRRFVEKWNNKSLLSWNLPEYLAYKEITED